MHNKVIENPVNLAEKAIDEEFNKSPLRGLDYAQAIWTLLSVTEDHHLKNQIDSLPDEHLHGYTDVLINALTHPIRSIYVAQKNLSRPIVKELKAEHYGWAKDWLDKATTYDAYCSIFPLWHRGKITLTVNENFLNTNDWKNQQIEYEVYNRLIRIRKDGNKEVQLPNQNNLGHEIMVNVTYNETMFDLNFNPKLVKLLIENHAEIIKEQYLLPDEWETSEFKLGEFKRIFIAIQALLSGWSTARLILAMQGMKDRGYPSAVWLVSLNESSSRLVRYTSLPEKTIKNILNYLTFGSKGIRYPDVAIQPLIDLKNGLFALSPFIWLNSNAERNFCVLLNQIPKEQSIYSGLTLEKEYILCHEIEKYVTDLGYEVKYGKLDKTNLDIAIIDRIKKVCICLELKWFIEPAEIREIVQRSEELEKGVSQAKIILKLYKHNDNKLINEILNIDSTYMFLVCVGSQNWIGHYDVQDDDIPIINIWHFLDKLKELGGLEEVSNWVKSRKYLPKIGIDYEIVHDELLLGDWHSSWYAIKAIA